VERDGDMMGDCSTDATGNALSLTVDSWVCQTTKDVDEADTSVVRLQCLLVIVVTQLFTEICSLHVCMFVSNHIPAGLNYW